MPKQPAFPGLRHAMKKKQTRREKFLAERHAAERLARLNTHIETLLPDWDLAPTVRALQALRGVALISRD